MLLFELLRLTNHIKERNYTVYENTTNRYDLFTYAAQSNNVSFRYSMGRVSIWLIYKYITGQWAPSIIAPKQTITKWGNKQPVSLKIGTSFFLIGESSIRVHTGCYLKKWRIDRYLKKRRVNLRPKKAAIAFSTRIIAFYRPNLGRVILEVNRKC